MTSNALIALVLALAAAIGFGGYQYQRAERYQSQVEPLKESLRDARNASEGHRKALAACVAESLRVSEANRRALKEAAVARDLAASELEEYLRRLDSPGADCDEILKAKVCPRLMGY